MPMYSPSGSSAASVIQALAWIIPVVAVALLCFATPTFRAAASGVLSRVREYFYGPDELDQSMPGASETSPSKESASAPAPVSELDTFDSSFYDEDPPEPS